MGHGTKTRGLGRGLDALLGDSLPDANVGGRLDPDQPGIASVAVDDVFPGRFQPRQGISDESLEELAASIEAQGLMQPIVVRPRIDGGYELIAGERRWRAAQKAGLERIPVVVKDVDDHRALAMALIENIQREDLNPLEEACALQQLVEEFDMTHQDVANTVGKSRTTVTNLLRLLNLVNPVRELVRSGNLEMGNARALLGLPENEQERVARIVVSRGLSVRQTEALVRRLTKAPNQGLSRRVEAVDPDTRALERELSDTLGAPVAIAHSARGRGKLVIRYTTLDELEGILRHLRR